MRNFYSQEEKIHLKNKSKLTLCFHENLYDEVTKATLDIMENDNIFKKLKDAKMRKKKKKKSNQGKMSMYLSKLNNTVIRAILLLIHYMDVIKDCYLIWSIIEIKFELFY